MVGQHESKWEQHPKKKAWLREPGDHLDLINWVQAMLRCSAMPRSQNGSTMKIVSAVGWCQFLRNQSHRDIDLKDLRSIFVLRFCNVSVIFGSLHFNHDGAYLVFPSVQLTWLVAGNHVGPRPNAMYIFLSLANPHKKSCYSLRSHNWYPLRRNQLSQLFRTRHISNTSMECHCENPLTYMTFGESWRDVRASETEWCVVKNSNYPHLRSAEIN
jgi:hypothetical protein